MNKSYLKTLLALYEKGELSKQGVHTLINHVHESHIPLSSGYAIVGLSCYMPEAKNKYEFMHNLYCAKNSIRDFPLSRRKDIDPLLAQLDPDSLFSGKTYWRGGFIDHVAFFDNAFFNILPAEAKIMDPQIRLFMQTAYHAFEDAGYTKERLQKYQVGIFIGDVNNEYRHIINEVNASSVVGNISPFIGARVARFYDFHGPVVNISTTCSSSLVAMHYALLSLNHGECNIALVGASNLRLFPFHLKDDPVSALGILSPDEQCRTFDDHANGIVRGEGVLAFIVKRVEDAIRDNDYIYATILSSMTNNDGLSSSIGAPNPVAQQQLLINAWKKAGIHPSDIKYIEAHGTGTKIGDPIEIQAMTNAFREFTHAKQFCGIGSIKTNIGHLTGGGAGLAGLFKVVCGLDKRQIPASLNFTIPNSLIDFTSSPIFVVDEVLNLSKQSQELAGVSAFGFNGTHCHMVLASQERTDPNTTEDKDMPFVFSARHPDILKELLQLHRNAITNGWYDDYPFHCISYTLFAGREYFDNRVCLFAKSLIELALKIKRILHDWNALTSSQNDLLIFFHESEENYKAYRLEANVWLYHNEIPERWRQHNGVHTVPLVTYPFQGKHYWPDAPVLKDYSTKISSYAKTVPTKSSEKNVKNALLAIWQGLLGLQDIEDNVSFFTLGGDSLLAVQLLTMIRSCFDKDISYEEFANHSTIEQLTGILNSNSSSTIQTIPIQAIPAQIAPLSHAQYRMWIMRHHQIQGNAYNMPQLFTIKLNLNIFALQNAVRAIIKKYEILRTVFILQDKKPVQKIECYREDFVIHEVDLTDTVDSKSMIIYHCQKLTQQIFALDQLYLFSCTVFKVNPKEYTICFVCDHMICDGWSLHLLMQEIFEEYLMIKKSNDKLNIQFKDFAIWEHGYLKSDDAKKGESFWQSKLQNYRNNAEIQGDFMRPTTFDYKGKDFLYTIDAETGELIRKFVNDTQVTLYELLISSVFVLIHLYSHQKDIILGSVSSGRVLKELETQIGCFTNLLPIRQYLDENYTFNLLVHEVRLFLRQALAFQSHPFDKMVEGIKLPTDFSRHPLFSVHVSLQDYKYLERMHKELQSLNVEHIYLPNDSAKWDLQFEFTDKNKYLEARLEYASSIYSAAFAEEITDNHCRLLKELLLKPDDLIATIKNIFTHKKQNHKLAFAWN